MSGGAGALLPGALLSGGLSGLFPGAGRALTAAGTGPMLVLGGLVLLVAAGTALRVRAVRAARAADLARRVRSAVLAAAERELARRTLEAERASGTPTGTRWRPSRGAPQAARPVLPARSVRGVRGAAA